MTVAPRAGPAPRNRCPAQIAVRLRARDDEYGNVTGTRTTEENACRLGAQDLAAFRSDPCGSTARQPKSSLSRRPQQAPAVGELADSLMGPLNRESSACGLDPEHGRTWRPRSRLRRGTGGSSCKEHGRPHGRGRCRPRSHSAEKKTVNFAWEKYHGRKGQSRSTGATGSAAAELAGFRPP